MAYDIREKIFRRIRLLKKSSFEDLASVEINLMGTKRLQVVRLENFEANTYNFDSGKIAQTTIDKNSFFTNKDGNIQTIKFTFPNIKEGSIIEYTFDLIFHTAETRFSI